MEESSEAKKATLNSLSIFILKLTASQKARYNILKSGFLNTLNRTMNVKAKIEEKKVISYFAF